jgi:hypothetical protein
MGAGEVKSADELDTIQRDLDAMPQVVKAEMEAHRSAAAGRMAEATASGLSEEFVLSAEELASIRPDPPANGRAWREIMARTQPDPLTRALDKAARDFNAREIQLRYLPSPSLTRWFAAALIAHHRVIEKIRADIPSGELTLSSMDQFNDRPVATGRGHMAIEAVQDLTPVRWTL